MRGRQALAGLLVAAAAVLLPPASAARPSINIVLSDAPAGTLMGFPSRAVLTCEAACPRLTPAHMDATYHPYAGFGADTTKALKDGQLGAMLDLSIMVAADGHVENVIVERSLGPKAFAADIIAHLMKSTLVPATEDGRPIESSLRYRWSVEAYVGQQAVRPDIINPFSTDDLLAHRTPQEALAYTDAALADETLLLRERAFISIARSNLCLRAGDVVCALDGIRDATVNGGTLIDQGKRADVIRQRIDLEARAGHYADALGWYDMMGQCCGLKNDAASAPIVKAIRETLAKPDPLVVLGATPPDPSVRTWHHTLLRRTFAFQDVSGALDRLELRCEGRGFKSPIGADSQWTMPKSWSGCELYVFGPPGTSFHLVEAA